MKFWMNGKLVSTGSALDFNSFNCPGGLTIGNDGKSHPFAGTIYYTIFFKEILDNDTIKSFMASVNSTVLLPKGGNNPLGVLSSDGRPCVTAPTIDPMPGQPGAPPAPNYEGSAKAAGAEDKSTNKDDGANDTNAVAAKEISALSKDNKKLADKVLNETGEDSGSDKSTCLMLASKF